MHARQAIAFLTATLALTTLASASAQANAMLGEWARGDGVARVKIVPCGGDYCAINTWIKPGVTDEKTGDKLVMSVNPAGPSDWTGTAFDPQRDRSYKISINVGGASMTTRGCILGGILCKSVGWRKLGN